MQRYAVTETMDTELTSHQAPIGVRMAALDSRVPAFVPLFVTRSPPTQTLIAKSLTRILPLIAQEWRDHSSICSAALSLTLQSSTFAPKSCSNSKRCCPQSVTLTGGVLCQIEDKHSTTCRTNLKSLRRGRRTLGKCLERKGPQSSWFPQQAPWTHHWPVISTIRPFMWQTHTKGAQMTYRTRLYAKSAKLVFCRAIVSFSTISTDEMTPKPA